MLFECSCMAFTMCGIAVASVAGNKLGLWGNWLMCAAGAFTFVIVLSLVTPLDSFAARFTAMLRFVGYEQTGFV